MILDFTHNGVNSLYCMMVLMGGNILLMRGVMRVIVTLITTLCHSAEHKSISECTTH